jgi:hypothetical protein
MLRKMLLILGLAITLSTASQRTFADLPGSQGDSSAVQARSGLGVTIEATSVKLVGNSPVLTGRVRSDAQCGLSASRRIRVDVVDASGTVRWTSFDRIDAKRPVRHSRLKRTGTFELNLPAGTATSAVRVSVVSAADVAASPS